METNEKDFLQMEKAPLPYLQLPRFMHSCNKFVICELRLKAIRMVKLRATWTGVYAESHSNSEFTLRANRTEKVRLSTISTVY